MVRMALVAKILVLVALVVVALVAVKFVAVSVVKNAESAERNEAKSPWVVDVPEIVDEAAPRPPVRFSFVPDAFVKVNAPVTARLVSVALAVVALPLMRYEMLAFARVDEPET